MTDQATETTAQAAHLKTLLESITDIGNVHGYPRYGNAAEKWVTTIGGVNTIRAWEIGLDDPGIEVDHTYADGMRNRIHHWAIRGYFALADGSDAEGYAGDPGYTALLAMAGRVADTIDADRNLGGNCLQHEWTVTGAPAPVSVPVGNGFLCWGITLNVDAWSLDTP